MSHSCVQLYLHIIFSTKNRKPLIPQEMEHRLLAYMSGIANKHNAPILEINGTSDHIHILMKFNASSNLSTIVKELKSYSTGWLKKQGYRDFAWQEGYGAFSCSIGHVPSLIEYIKNQKEHHKKYSFKEELARICALWKVEWCLEDKDVKDNEVKELEVLI